MKLLPKTVKEWFLYGENGHMPRKQIFDPKTKQVKDPTQCPVIHIFGRLIFEDLDRLITPHGGARDNPTFGATFEKTFLPFMSEERQMHQYYLSIEGLEIFDAEGAHLIEKRDTSSGVLIAKPINGDKR